MTLLRKSEALRCGELLASVSPESLSEVREATVRLLAGPSHGDLLGAVSERFSFSEEEQVRFRKWSEEATCREVEDMLCSCIELRRPLI